MDNLDNIERKVEKFETNYVSKMNVDTLSAILVIEKNIGVLKSHAFDKSLLQKQSFMIEFLLKEFPMLDRNIIQKKLRERFILSVLQINIIISLFILTIGILLFAFTGFKVSDIIFTLFIMFSMQGFYNIWAS